LLPELQCQPKWYIDRLVGPEWTELTGDKVKWFSGAKRRHDGYMMLLRDKHFNLERAKFLPVVHIPAIIARFNIVWC
jgi:hypothetical protein